MGNGQSAQPESESTEHCFAKDPKEAKCLDLGAKYKGAKAKKEQKSIKYYVLC